MALDYTVNWIEQGRTPVEQNENQEFNTRQTQRRIVLSNGRYFRQSRTRNGVTTYTTVKTLCNITYKADTITTEGGGEDVVTQITESQAAEIQAQVYEDGCVSCTTAREGGPVFAVTKVVESSTPLVASTTSETTWEDWGDWEPTLPA